ncbi:MAG: hypothetical protein JST30_13300 [Armatimonadetes bacterium]|nr:hypothetical protein [Armatimonadota bacterium]
MSETVETASQALERELKASIDRAVEANGGDTAPIRPGHRVPFHWPPHPVSKDFHVLPSDWTGRATLTVAGEEFEVQIARTAQGVFGRIERVWNEARSQTVEDVLVALREGAEPYFARQAALSRCLGRQGRFEGLVRDLTPVELVRLLYCPDRDIAQEAQLAIETNASSGVYSDALIHVLEDDRHPHRRIAQWCVLDMFEDLPSFCPDPETQARAIDAVKSLIWSAGDDYARTVYKAGVVLGGHICTDRAAEALLACVGAPSKFGRRSAVHAVFHLAEWMPEYRDRTVSALEEAARSDPEDRLREFAASMARDVRSGAFDHMTEPAFPEEL